MAININIPIEDAVTDGSLNPVTSNAVFDALALKANSADLATVATTGDYNDLSNLPAIPSAQVNSDWNATSGVAEILNKPTIPSIAGLVPDTRNLTINGTTYDLSADRSWVIAATASTLQHAVKAGEAMTKGQAVYVSSADGTNMIVSKASNVTEATSSKTMGLIIETLALNGQGTVITEGLLAGLNTSSATAGDPVWLGTNGNLIYGLINKPAAPAHLVFIGIVTRANVSNGEIFVRVQNGFELQELHNVSITSVADNNLLQYDSATSLWKNESLSTAGIQPTLVSATNIKTINGNSLLGSGDLVISGGAIAVGTTAVTSGTVGRVFFQETGDVVQQDSALFWDNTNKRLGIGATPATTVRLDVRAQGALSTDIAFRVRNSADTANIISVQGNNTIVLPQYPKIDTTSGTFIQTNSFGSLYVGTGNTSIANYTNTVFGNSNTLSGSFDNYTILGQSNNLAGNRNIAIGISNKTSGDASIRIGTSVGQDTFGGNYSMHFGRAGAGGFITYSANEVTNFFFNDYRTSQMFRGNGSILLSGKNSQITTDANVTTFMGDGGNTLVIRNHASIPSTNVTDSFQQYSADIVAGNAAPHFRTENGGIIKLYQETTAVAASTFVSNTSLIANDTATFDGYTIGQVVKALRNLGILA
jgi:hypothetical protein